MALVQKTEPGDIMNWRVVNVFSVLSVVMMPPHRTKVDRKRLVDDTLAFSYGH
jgi:hypothetical protein